MSMDISLLDFLSPVDRCIVTDISLPVDGHFINNKKSNNDDDNNNNKKK